MVNPKPKKPLPPGLTPRGGPGGSNAGLWAALAALGLLELCMLALLYTTYSETMGMMGGVYLCEQPLVGPLFCAVDEDMTISHLLAIVLAVFSIFVPMAIWHEVLRQEIHKDPAAWLSQPINKVYAVIAALLIILIFALEAVNIYTIIARQMVGGPFATTQKNALIEALANNQGLGLFVAVLIAVVNFVLALLTVRAAHAIKQSMKGDF